jgi:hypothetical protein
MRPSGLRREGVIISVLGLINGVRSESRDYQDQGQHPLRLVREHTPLKLKMMSPYSENRGLNISQGKIFGVESPTGLPVIGHD